MSNCKVGSTLAVSITFALQYSTVLDDPTTFSLIYDVTVYPVFSSILSVFGEFFAGVDSTTTGDPFFLAADLASI